MTPEGKVKAAIKKLLDRYNVKYDMPVPGGFGKSQLDFTCCWRGRCLIIEAKAPDGELTGRQALQLIEWHAAGALTFVISNSDGLAALERRLQGTPWKHFPA